MTEQPGVPEDVLLARFEMTDREQLHRLGLFLLGHALLDRWLIHLLADTELAEIIKKDPPSVLNLDEHAYDSLVTKHSEGTFMKHLNAVRAKGTFPQGFFDVCEELNRARDHFLHWKPGRFSVPKYRGFEVTTEEGCLAALHAVDDAIRAIFGGEE